MSVQLKHWIFIYQKLSVTIMDFWPLGRPSDVPPHAIVDWRGWHPSHSPPPRWLRHLILGAFIPHFRKSVWNFSAYGPNQWPQICSLL